MEFKSRDVNYTANTAYVRDIQHGGELNCNILSAATTKCFALTLQITLDFLRHYRLNSNIGPATTTSFGAKPPLLHQLPHYRSSSLVLEYTHTFSKSCYLSETQGLAPHTCYLCGLTTGQQAFPTNLDILDQPAFSQQRGRPDCHDHSSPINWDPAHYSSHLCLVMINCKNSLKCSSLQVCFWIWRLTDFKLRDYKAAVQ